jgi:uncharacterized protein
MKNIFLFLFFISISFAQQDLPVIKAYATDLTATLNQEELTALNLRLQAFDDSTSNQLVFLMIPSLNGNSLEEFANKTAIKNKIGTKKNDNGILFLVVKNDRKMRIEVGYGLEGALPDALASSIIRNVVKPYFQNGDYYAGISSGIDAIIAATKGEYKAEVHHKNQSDDASGIITLLIFLFFIVSFFIRGGRGRGNGFIFWGGLGSGGFSGSGFGGGGFGGGGFSGGGGSFGGGGASGGW